jgi:hypothetical protein
MSLGRPPIPQSPEAGLSLVLQRPYCRRALPRRHFRPQSRQPAPELRRYALHHRPKPPGQVAAGADAPD